MPKKPFLLFSILTFAAITLPVAARAGDAHVQQLYQHYYKIIYTMAEDKIEDVEKELESVKSLLGDIEKDDCLPAGSLEELKYTLTLVKADNLYNLRNSIHLLSFQLKYLARQDETIVTYPVRCAHTPADWLQGDDKEIRNPYLGPGGKECGQFVRIRPIKKAGQTEPLPPLE